MTFISNLRQDITTALKARDKGKVSTLRLLLSSLLNAEKSSKVEFTDDMSIQILAKEVKKRRDAIVEFGDRADPKYKNGLEKEINILSVYLPKQLTKDEIKQMAIEIIEKNNINGIKGMGLVMKQMVAMTSGKADGGVVSKIVRELLN